MGSERRSDHPQTRMEAFRRREALKPSEWAAAAGITHQKLLSYRKGKDPTIATAARIVRGARRILRRPVRASEIFNVGEDDTLPLFRPDQRRSERETNTTRKTYPTPLDKLMRELGVTPAELARESGVSRQHLVELRAGRRRPRISMVAAVVSALRAITLRPVRAYQLYDVGEAENDDREEPQALAQPQSFTRRVP